MTKKKLFSPFAKFFRMKEDIQNEKFNKRHAPDKETEELLKTARELIEEYKQNQQKENSPFSKFLK